MYYRKTNFRGTEGEGDEGMAVTLPKWLDDYIYNELGAKYCRSNSDMTVIDWDKKDVLNYLGTYFPRSYAEAYTIFSSFLNKTKYLSDKESISLFDFGCGTGGEIIGLLTAISECRKNIKEVNIVAFDGNQHALRLYESVFEIFRSKVKIEIKNRIAPIEIDDFYDLEVLDSVLRGDYDLIISFKAICEFVTKQRFEEVNAYKHIANTFLPKLKNDGLMLLVDVTTYSNTSQEWLPKMMDAGLRECDCSIIAQNEGYNQVYYVTHSHRCNDISKVAWRMIKKI